METKVVKGTVKGAAGRKGIVGVQAPEKARTTLGLKTDAKRVRQAWYLKREGELEEVTFNAHNEALGITDLEVFGPTDNQLGMGILCKVRMNTLSGTDENITIFESERTAGEIYLRMSGARKVETGEGDAKNVRWFNDRKLNRATEAQILSFVSTLLVPAKG